MQSPPGAGLRGGAGRTETAWVGALLTAVDPGYHEYLYTVGVWGLRGLRIARSPGLSGSDG